MIKVLDHSGDYPLIISNSGFNIIFPSIDDRPEKFVGGINI
jgi:hypothetical protein